MRHVLVAGPHSCISKPKGARVLYMECHSICVSPLRPSCTLSTTSRSLTELSRTPALCEWETALLREHCQERVRLDAGCGRVKPGDASLFLSPFASQGHWTQGSLLRAPVSHATGHPASRLSHTELCVVWGSHRIALAQLTPAAAVVPPADCTADCHTAGFYVRTRVSGLLLWQVIVSLFSNSGSFPVWWSCILFIRFIS